MFFRFPGAGLTVLMVRRRLACRQASTLGGGAGQKRRAAGRRHARRGARLAFSMRFGQNVERRGSGGNPKGNTPTLNFRNVGVLILAPPPGVSRKKFGDSKHRAHLDTAPDWSPAFTRLPGTRQPGPPESGTPNGSSLGVAPGQCQDAPANTEFQKKCHKFVPHPMAIRLESAFKENEELIEIIWQRKSGAKT